MALFNEYYCTLMNETLQLTHKVLKIFYFDSFPVAVIFQPIDRIVVIYLNHSEGKSLIVSCDSHVNQKGLVI